MKPTTRQRTSHTHNRKIHNNFNFGKLNSFGFFFSRLFRLNSFSRTKQNSFDTLPESVRVCLLFIWYHSQNQWQRNTKLIDTHTPRERGREAESGRSKKYNILPIFIKGEHGWMCHISGCSSYTGNNKLCFLAVPRPH